MDEKIYVSNKEGCDALGAKVNTAKKFPCCECIDETDPACICGLHKYPGGKEAPHHLSRTITEDVAVPHPTDPSLWYYPIKEDVKAIARDDTGKVDPAIKDALAVEIAKAVDKTEDWVILPPPIVREEEPVKDEDGSGKEEPEGDVKLSEEIIK